MQPNNINSYPQGPMMPPQNGMPAQPQIPANKPPIGFILALVITVLLLFATLVFAIWSFGKMQDYKNNSDQKSAAAVAAANSQLKNELQAQFDEQSKSPLKSYTTPAQYGSVKLVYPKTWSAYVVESGNSGTVVDGYFYPDFVPNITDKNNYYLRIQMVSTAYTDVLNSFSGAVKQGAVKVSAFAPEQVKGAAAGVKISGQITPEKQGTMIVLPIRDKTLKLWTENDQAAADYATVLKNLTYSP